MKGKTKEQLIEEVALLREEVAELKQEKAERKRAEEALRQERNRAQKYLDVAGVMFVVIYAKEEVALINQKGCEILGYEQQEIIGKNWFDNFLPERMRDEVKSVFQKLVAGQIEPVEYFENPVLTKSGKERMIAWHNTVLRDEAGNIIGTLSSGEDITERKKAEEAVRESEKRYRTLFESKLDGMFVIDAETMRIVLANQAAAEMYGFSSVEEGIGVNPLDFVASEEGERSLKIMVEDMFEKDLQEINEFRTITKDGKEKWISAVGARIEYQGKLAGLVSFREITERKRVQEGLRKAEADWRGSFNALEDVMLIMDKDYNIEKINDQGLALLNKSSEEVIGQKCYKIISGADGPPENCPCRQSLKTRKVESVDRYEERFGKYFSIKSSPVFDENGEVVRFVDLRRDITERKRVTQQLKESEERYRALVEASGRMGEAIILLQNTDKVEAAHLFANQEWVRITGYTAEELREISYFDLIHPRDRHAVADRNRRRLQGEDVPGLWEIYIIAKDGSEVPVEGIGALLTYQGRPAVVGYNRDITERRKAKEEIEQQRNYFQALFDGSPEAVASLDVQNLIVDINPAFEKLFGYKLEDIKGRDIDDCVVPGSRKEEGKSLGRRALAGEVVAAESVRRRSDGREIPVSILTAPIVLDGKQIGTFAIYRNITERKRAEQQLKESEERYRAIVEAGAHMGEAIFLLQNTDKVEAAHLFVNDEWARMTGYTAEQLREISYLDLVHPRHRDAVADRVRRRIQGELLPGPWEISIVTKDGTEVPVEATGTPITYQGRPAVVGYIRDITERKKAEEKIQASLREKEILLKEIHHRVKNNLQVVSSLLKLQSGYIEDERYAEMFKESQERVRSMALVHEKLYQSKDLARIDLAGYIESMVQELRQAYATKGGRIAIKAEVEGVRLGVNQAIPCGLIINELVSNSLKHAFPDGKRGEVRVAMRQVGGDEVELEVSDNGAGIPESMEIRDAESLGLRLVTILAEEQLRGEMELDRTEGTRFWIRFRVRE